MNLRAKLLLTHVISAIVLVAAATDDASKRDVEKMQGEWQLVSMVRDGQEQPKSELSKMTRKVAGNELTIVVEGAEGVATLKSTLAIDATKSPKPIDVTRTNGPTRGQTALGIYEFDGDQLRTCVAPPGKDRPTEFASAAGSGHVLTVWNRVKSEVKSSDSKLDPKAIQWIEQVSKTVASAKAIRADGTVATTGDLGGRARPKTQSTWAMETPNRFKLRLHSEENSNGGIEMICDGEKMFVYHVGRKEYIERAAPQGLTDLGGRLPMIGVPTVGLVFRNLLTPEPAESLMLGVNSCVYAGIERIDGKPAHYLKFTQDDFNWELWVAAEGKPVVLKMRSVFPGDIVIVESYKNWQFDVPSPPDTFTFKPPEGAEKVERLGELND